jgi:hypothetical protein
MTTAPETTHSKAVPGRRVTYSYTSDKTIRTGVITSTTTATNGILLVLVRLDGARSNLHIPADHELLTYLDEVGPVPELPMGRFHPDSSSLGFDFQYDGVAVCGFEDGDAVAVTDDRSRAEAAIATWMREFEGIDDEHTIRESLAWMKPQWAVFEWQPEDSECVWLMNTVSEGDDQAVHVYYLPA